MKTSTANGITDKIISKYDKNMNSTDVDLSIIPFEALNTIFDLDFTNGHLKVYIDGEFVFDDDVEEIYQQ